MLKKRSVYCQIESNNRKIIALVVFFPIALLLFVGAFFCLFGLMVDPEARQELMSLFAMIMPWLMVVCLGLTLMSVCWGDKMMLSFSKAEPCTSDNKHHLKIYRAVENVALAAGLPMPKVYLINDSSLNAFATGFSPKNASIALTTGLVEKLEPLELQAVVAHEMAHIKNRDVRLNMYIITGIGIIGLVGEVLLRTCGRSNRSNQKGNLGVFLLLTACLFLLFRYLIAPIIHMAISRNQEFQADATGAFFTRNPAALASALQKISKDPRVEVLDKSTQMSVACIYNPLAKINGLLDTHPPVADRIQRLTEMS